MYKKMLLVILVSFLFTGCANTRNPNPCLMKQGSDNGMKCEQIIAEYNANTDAAEYKISKNESDDKQDILLGLLIWPGLADFKNADGTEGNALLDRNIYLRELCKTKDCDISNLPSQPSRYD